jgi:hypothetical protein
LVTNAFRVLRCVWFCV